MSYEEDHYEEVTEEQITALQKMADDSARARGETPPSEIPEERFTKSILK